jgi:hypothetical protein
MSREKTTTIQALALLAGGLGCSPAQAERIDRVVAVVGDRVVTSWDLQLEQVLEARMPCPEPPLCDPDRSPLDRVVDRSIIRGLAADTVTYRPSAEELELRLAALRDGWEQIEGYQQALAALGASERDLSGLLYSRLVVEHYVQRHVALPVYASGGGSEDYALRYRSWIEQQRELVRIRLISPDEPDAP